MSSSPPRPTPPSSVATSRPPSTSSSSPYPTSRLSTPASSPPTSSPHSNSTRPSTEPPPSSGTPSAAPSILRHLADSASSPPLCLISDFYLSWTLSLCLRLGIPRLVFHGMSAFSMAISKPLWLHCRNTLLSADSPSFHLPGKPASLLLSHDEVPLMIKQAADGPDNPLNQFLNELEEFDVRSWGVLVNSYAVVDPDYVELFESFYRDGPAHGWWDPRNFPIFTRDIGGKLP